jgi:hypothetical protein
LLTKNIKRAKTARMQAAILVKGKDTRLLLSKTKVKPTQIAVVKKEIGGGRLLRAVCFGENGRLVFEFLKDPPAPLERILKKVIKQWTKVATRPLCRKAASTSNGVAEKSDDAPAPKRGPSFEFQRRVAALVPDLKDALKLNGAAGEIKALFQDARGLARDKKFAEANARLDELTKLIERALESESDSKSKSGDGETLKAQWTRRMAELTPDLKVVLVRPGALSKRVKLVIKEAKTLAGGGKYAEAIERLDSVAEDVRRAAAAPAPTLIDAMSADEIKVRSRMSALSVMLPKARRLDTTGEVEDLEAKLHTAREAGDFGTALETIEKLESLVKTLAPPPKQTGPKVAFATARLSWSKAKAEALGSLNGLRDKIKSQRPEDADLADNVAAALDAFDDRLYSAIKDAEQAAADADSAQGEAKTTATNLLGQKKVVVRGVLDEYLRNLTSNPKIKLLDANPFYATNLRETLSDPLVAIVDLVKA